MINQQMLVSRDFVEEPCLTKRRDRCKSLDILAVRREQGKRFLMNIYAKAWSTKVLDILERESSKYVSYHFRNFCTILEGNFSAVQKFLRG